MLLSIHKIESLQNIPKFSGIKTKIPHKIVLISGDGDYKKLVNYLIEKGVFLKIFFPCQKFVSSLYKSLGNKFTVALDRPDIKKLIEYKK